MTATMNKDEKTSEKYLNTIYEDIIFEPDGNIPPDFAYQNGVGIEVRRLNQQVRNGGQTKGLEEFSIPLEKAIKSELLNYNNSNSNKFYLRIRYARGLETVPSRTIKKGVKKFIQEFEGNEENYPFEKKIADNIYLKVFSQAISPQNKYTLGIYSDQDSGGWVVKMYIDEISHYMDEKTLKISKYINNYNNWWLLLVDHINLIDDYDIDEIKQGLTKISCWQKVIIINTDSELIFEI